MANDKKLRPRKLPTAEDCSPVLGNFFLAILVVLSVFLTVPEDSLFVCICLVAWFSATDSFV